MTLLIPLRTFRESCGLLIVYWLFIIDQKAKEVVFYWYQQGFPGLRVVSETSF